MPWTCLNGPRLEDTELWRVLATGLDSPDPLRRSFLLRLHGPGRGVSQWMSSRSVVPTGLLSPFSERLPKLNPDARIEVAGSVFEDPLVVAALAAVDDIAALASKRTIVTKEIARLLAPLMTNAPSVCQPEDLLQALTDHWKNLVTPKRLQSLRPLADDVVFRSLQVSPNAMLWSASLLARSKAGNERPLRRLLLSLAHDLERSDADIQDELYRAAFADDDWVLDPVYLTCAADVRLFRRLRGSFEVDARTMSLWCNRLPESRHEAALRYLLRGRLGGDIVALLAPISQRPDWLQTYECVARKLDSLGDEHWRTLSLLARLFPEQFQAKTSEVIPTGGGAEPAASDYLTSLADWWNDEGVRASVASLYEQKAWPDFLREGGVREGLKAESRDHWLGLLVLGACRSLGRSTEAQHRSFLEWAHQEGWWQVFQQPREQKTWMEALEKWQDNATANLERARWMSLFPTIFQFSRHLDKYKRLLLGAGRRPADFYTITCLLAPRVDDRLTFAGANFDAPPAPLNMGLHWILRELVRMQVIDGSHLYPDCWVPSRRLVNFLAPMGLVVPEDSASNVEKARAVFAFMKERLAVETQTFYGAFDIPLIYAAGQSSFEISLDLENDP